MSTGGRLGIAVSVTAILCVAAAPAWAASIGGTVADEATQEGLEGVLVCAYESLASESEAEAGKKCAESEESGEYVIGGIPAGFYKVRFQPQSGSKYASELYDDVSSWEEAETVEVIPSSLTPGIDAALAEVKSDEGPQGEEPLVDPPAAPPTTVAAPPAALSAPVKPKPLRCKKGFRKRKVKGKTRCVKVRPVKRSKSRHPANRKRPAGKARRFWGYYREERYVSLYMWIRGR